MGADTYSLIAAHHSKGAPVTGTRLGPADPAGFDVYLDESGHTGLNFLDREQPLFVEAGWIVPRGRLAQAERLLSATLSALGRPKELKGSRQLQTARGREAIAALLEAYRDIDLRPTFALFEKQYTIAAKIIETYIDYGTNPLVPAAATGDPVGRQALANQLYELPTGSLDRAWEAIRVGSEAEMAETLVLLTNRAALLGYSSLARLLRAALPSVGEIATLERTGPDVPGAMRWKEAALTLPSFYSLIADIDQLAERAGVAPDVRVFHDETSSVGPALAELFNINAGRDPTDLKLLDGRVVRMGFGHLKSLTFLRSKESLLIQAADALAAVISEYALKGPFRDPTKVRLRHYWYSLAGLAMTPAPNATVIGVSDRIMPRLGER